MVRIQIDTAKDSPEEIRKTIRYLQSLLGQSGEAPEDAPAPEFADMMGMFDGAPSEARKPDAASLVDDAGEEQEDKRDSYIEIVEY